MRPDVLFERLAIWLFVLTLAWAPFPLGSNRPWSWSLLSLLVASCWLLWWCANWRRPETTAPLFHDLIGPLVLLSLAIAWAIVQIVPIFPFDRLSANWPSASALIGHGVTATISISPWRTATEIQKLGTYLMAAWLARTFARTASGADNLLTAVIIIGALYAAYGFALFLAGQSQFEIFYGIAMPQTAHEFPGPFVNRNNFATYEGLVALCAGAKLVVGTWTCMDLRQDPHLYLLSGLHYVLGRGSIWLVAVLLSFSAVVTTASRGGNLATWSAMLALLFLGLGVASRQRRGWLGLAVASCIIAAVLGLFAINGSTLASHLNDMEGAPDTMRLLLWNAAIHMIGAAPLTGWGLGTYQIVYPLYAAQTMHFIIDKAHNDLLEFAAGFGLPAAILWWGGLVWLVGLCLRGVFIRRHNRMFPILAVGASILVAIHSIFDFSMQIPAIALTFATILAVGIAQAFPASQSRE